MSWTRRRALAGGASALILPGCARAQGAERQVLAFYYGWYGSGVHWPPAEPVLNQPFGGEFYDSLDPAVVARQRDQMRNAGITGLIASWWGPGDRTDRNLDLLLPAAVERGLKVTTYLEQADTAEAASVQLAALSDKARHPAWLRVGGRPVLFVFDRVLQTLGEEGWRAVSNPGFFVVGPANDPEEARLRAPLFDAVHIYSMTFKTDGWRWLLGFQARRWMRRWVEAQGDAAVTTATVLPGFDDRHLRAGDRPVTPRRNGETYDELWQAAVAAQPDWLLINSWNEWHEGSEIEPSDENGARELNATRAWTQRFLGG